VSQPRYVRRHPSRKPFAGNLARNQASGTIPVKRSNAHIIKLCCCP